jgi:hypothetical protein
MSFMSGRRGSARIERFPSARGPNSLEPSDDRAVGERGHRPSDQLGVIEPAVTQAGALERRPTRVFRELGAEERVIHHVRARLAEHVMRHVGRGPQARPAVVGRGLHVQVLEARLVADPAIHHAVQRHAAGEAERIEAGALVQGPQHRQLDLLQALLHRGGHVPVPRLERLVAAGPERPELRDQAPIPDRAELRAAAVPRHGRDLALETEAVHVQLEAHAASVHQDLAHAR